jgi:hypothetical protein
MGVLTTRGLIIGGFDPQRGYLFTRA